MTNDGVDIGGAGREFATPRGSLERWAEVAGLQSVPIDGLPATRGVDAAATVADVLDTFDGELASGDDRLIGTAGKIISYGGSAIVLGVSLRTAASIIVAGAGSPPALALGAGVAVAGVIGGALFQEKGDAIAHFIWQVSSRAGESLRSAVGLAP